MTGTGHIHRVRGLIFIAAAMAFATLAAAQDEVYRLKVLKGVGDKEARDYKIQLESLGYLPIYIVNDVGGNKDLYYGNFANRQDALKMKTKLEREGFTVESLDKTPRNMGSSAPAVGGAEYTILVGDYGTPEAAGKIKDKLDELGKVGVKLEGAKVVVGKYKSADDSQAQTLLASLLDSGFAQSKVVALTAQGTVGDAAPVAPSAKPPSAKEMLGPSGDNLSPEVMKKVDEYIKMKMEIGSGANSAIINQLTEMEKSLKALQVNVTDIDKRVSDITIKREDEARKRVTIAQLFREADHLIKGKRFQDAIVKLREILNIDAENQVALSRIRMAESLAGGEKFEGENEALEKKYEQVKAMAQQEESRNSLASLTLAKAKWQEIATYHERYVPEAEGRIAALDQKIKLVETTALEAQGGMDPKLIAILIGAVGFLAVIVVFLFIRSRKQHRDMLAKIQEATALRPMRGIPQGRRASDWMLMAPGASPMPGDQMGGQGGGEHDSGYGDPAPMGGGMGHAPQGAGFGPTSPASGAAMDDLFAPEPAGGGHEPEPAPMRQRAASAASSMDDILSGIGPAEGGKSPAASKPRPAPAAAEAAFDMGLNDILGGATPQPAAAQAKMEDSSSGFSIDDILGTGSSNGAPPMAEPVAKRGGAEAKPAGGASIFDDLESLTGGIGKGGVSSSKPAPAGVGSSLGDSSLDALLGLGSSPAPAASKPAAKSFGGSSVADDIPALRFDSEPTDPLAGLGLLGEETIIERPSVGPPKTGGGGGGFDLGGLGLSGASPEAAETMGGLGGASANGLVYSQGFDGDSVGKRPAAWDGDYPYSELVVENDTPPDGAKNYLVYRKREGVGKVYYATKFPNTSGVVQVEFDLRCNDKNKFLLGFYIEKDEDFQQSIHTKILRSESQTAPSIHIHGQPAPYLLGTWARIKYVIDLNHGKVDGYVDDRHVARSIPLPQAPKYLNTLAIRDNINTTGVLFIDNVKVSKVG